MAIFNNPKGDRRAAVGVGGGADDELIEALLGYEIRARTMRSKIFDPSVINDSSWPIVQHLFAAYLKGKMVRTKEAYMGTGLPQTTALRYIDHLEKCEVVRREEDPMDGRVSLVSVTESGALWLREYYSQILRCEEELAKKKNESLFSLRS